MFREQTDNERVDYKGKTDGHTINNHRKACDICTHKIADTTKTRISGSYNLPKFRLEIRKRYIMIFQSLIIVINLVKCNSTRLITVM